MDTPVFLQNAAICCSIKRDGEEEALEIALGLFCTWLRFISPLTVCYNS